MLITEVRKFKKLLLGILGDQFAVGDVEMKAILLEIGIVRSTRLVLPSMLRITIDGMVIRMLQ
jgi:hypothetical protein